MVSSEPQAFLAVASRFESIELVQAVMDDLLQSHSMSDEVRHWIGLAVREALANAIKHGNHEASDKQVEVELCVADLEVEVKVRDHGSGFEPDEVPDPLAPANLLLPGGRGIFYMRRLMDDVEFRFGEAGGTEVILRKRVIPPTGDTRGGEEEES